MLKSFRQFTKSRFGLIIVFIVLGLIAVAFGLADVSGVRTGTSGSGAVVANVGGRDITESELRNRIDIFVGNLRRQGRSFTMEDFIAQGGVESALEETINSVALEEFGQRAGLQVSKALIDGEIASNPVFQGIDGKFDQKAFEALLARERISPKVLREDMARDRYGRWLIQPALPGNYVPASLITPYASLMLERRTGTAAFVRTIDMDPGAAPDDRALQSYYQTNRQRYLVPQRRVIRYSLVSTDQIRARMTATDAEIADAYRKASARFAASEKRTVRQVVIADQNAANAAVAQLRGGKSVAEVAGGLGLEATNFDAVDKATLARQAAPAVADAAFAAQSGAVIGPVRMPIGWAVLKVESVQAIPARSLAEARAELSQEIIEGKVVAEVTRLRQAIDDGIGNGETFDEIVAGSKLTGARTAALTANGLNPDDPASKPDPALQPIVRTGFLGETGDDPQIVPVGEEGNFALVAVERIVPAAPKPLASIRAEVVRDYQIDKALQKAREVANTIVTQVNKGTPLAQAVAASGYRQTPTTRFDLKRADLANAQTPPEAQVQMAFRMAPRTAKLVPARDRSGYYVVWLENVEQHDASKDQQAIQRTRAEIAPQLLPEMAQQFMEAIKRDLVVTRNNDVLARIKADLARTGTAG